MFKNGELLFSVENGPDANPMLQFYRQLKVEYPKFHKMDALCKLGWLAAEVAMTNHKHDQTDPNCAVVLSNKTSSIRSDHTFNESLESFPSPAVFVYTLPSIVLGEICIRHRLQGENLFVIFEKFNAAALLSLVQQSARFGEATTFLTGWLDCSLDTFEAVLFYGTINGEGIPFNEENLQKIYRSKNGITS